MEKTSILYMEELQGAKANLELVHQEEAYHIKDFNISAQVYQESFQAVSEAKTQDCFDMEETHSAVVGDLNHY